MKTKQKLILVGTMLLFLSMSQIVRADVTISNVIYDPTVKQGDPISIKVLFSYSVTCYLYGEKIYAYYSVNKNDVSTSVKYVSATIPTETLAQKPSSLTLTISTIKLNAGDIVRFEIRYSWRDLFNSDIHSEVSQVYSVTILTPQGETVESNLQGSAVYLALVIATLVVSYRFRFKETRLVK